MVKDNERLWNLIRYSSTETCGMRMNLLVFEAQLHWPGTISPSITVPSSSKFLFIIIVPLALPFLSQRGVNMSRWQPRPFKSSRERADGIAVILTTSLYQRKKIEINIQSIPAPEIQLHIPRVFRVSLVAWGLRTCINCRVMLLPFLVIGTSRRRKMV